MYIVVVNRCCGERQRRVENWLLDTCLISTHTPMNRTQMYSQTTRQRHQWKHTNQCTLSEFYLGCLVIQMLYLGLMR